MRIQPQGLQERLTLLFREQVRYLRQAWRERCRVAATSRGSAAASKAGGKKKRRCASGPGRRNGTREVAGPRCLRGRGTPRDLEISSVDSFQVARAPRPPPCRSAAP